MSAALTLIVLALLVIGVYVLCYNGLVAARQKVDQGWSGITVQLKRRHALVPNLVQSVRSAMDHESGMLDRILEARSTALAALAGNDHADVAKAEAALSDALGRFVGYTEDNPEITAGENIALLQKQLEETEDQIAAARRLYNGNVEAYNTKVLSIPWTFIARMNNYKTEPMFDVDPVEMKRIVTDPSVGDLGLGPSKT